jgi:transcriptional regulator with XRE-family HTH domain
LAKAGAKSKYDTLVKPYLDEINEKIRQGITESEIAKALGISVATLNNYKIKYPELKEALNKNKGADVLKDLINAGIEAAKGYFKNNESTVIVTDENGNPTIKQKTVTKTWFPPNPVLHKFYVLNFGKDQGLVNDPLEYELRVKKQEFEEAEAKAKNWDIDF